MGSDSPFSATPSGQTQKVGPASPKRLDTLGRLGLVIVTLGFIVTAGCSTNIIDQATSLLGTRTEELRDWVREDPQRDKLIVFVHGFNSSKEEAWGQFPALLKDDADFMDFNIHRFGYPTKLCRQVSDIRNEGEFLASFLTSTLQRVQPKYRQVVLIGHSLGGLVILHALLKLERDHWPLLTEQDLKVLTFGTPYLGVENTDVLELFCENKQVNDMHVLNDMLGELAREWTQRFNQKPVSGGRDTPQVPLYAFRGTKDRFVSKTSACGYPQTPCEPVDGDHNSIVKPKDQTHLAYQKLKQRATQPKVPRTATGKIGIWVARLTGDDPSHAAQRDIARRLEHVISQGEPQLHEAVEIRELPTDIEGNTLKEKEAEAKRLGQYEQASIVVWGDVTGSVMHLRVTLVKPLGLTTKTVILAPRSHASELPQLSTPPETVHMLPQSVKEPLQLARFVLALTFMEQQAWAKAAEQLEYYIGATPSTAVRLGDVYFYAGFIHFSVFSTSGMAEPLTTARNMCEKAAADYQREKNWADYAGVQNNLGVIYRILAQRGVAPEENLWGSVAALKEAARRYKGQQSWAEYAVILNNLGLTYRVLAERGVAPEENLRGAIEALREAACLRLGQEGWADYAGVLNNLGVTYRVLADRGVAPKKNLQHSVVVLMEAARLRLEQENWADYAMAQNNLGMTYRVLAEYGVTPEENLRDSVEVLTEAARQSTQQENWADYAMAQANLGLTYQVLAERGVAPKKNLQHSVVALREAAHLRKKQENWADYAGVLSNLGATYRMLAEYGVTPEENLRDSVEVLTEAACRYTQQQNWAEYAGVLNNLGLTYKVLAERSVAPKKNLQHSVVALTEAARRYTQQQNWANYATVQYNLGRTYRVLADYDVEFEENLRDSVEALTEAARQYKEQENWAAYAMVQINLGLTYWVLAQRGVAPDENLRLANQAFKEASVHGQD